MAGEPLSPLGRLDDVRSIGSERIRQERLHAENAEGMRRAAISYDHPTPGPEQTIDGVGGVGEGNTSVSQNCHPLTTLEVGSSHPVVDELTERVTRVTRGGLGEIDDQATTCGGGQTERSDVVQNRVGRTNCEHPVDEVSLRHGRERTNPDGT